MAALICLKYLQRIFDLTFFIKAVRGITFTVYFSDLKIQSKV